MSSSRLTVFQGTSRHGATDRRPWAVPPGNLGPDGPVLDERRSAGPEGRGVSRLRLSSHLTKLEEAGLVAIEKRFVRKKPNTNIALTGSGRTRITQHWEQLDQLRRLSEPSP
jgi:hypothetical protein